MRILTALLCCLLLVTARAQETTVYKNVRPDGTVEFSDEPAAGEAVDIPPVQTYTPPPAPPAPRPAPAPAPGAAAERPVVRYELQVTEPTPDSTVFFDAEGMPVSVTIKPDLQPGHAIAIYLDGRQAARGTATHYVLTGVFRGTHTLAAAVEANGGATLLRSKPVTFHLIQHARRP